jgi:hypothetical protein
MGIPMTEELTEREGARRGSVETSPTRLLEAAHRMYAAADEAALGVAIAGFFALLLGAPPVAVRIAHDSKLSRRFGAETLNESVNGLLDRARGEGLPVLDGQPPIGIALPVASGGRTVAAVYVAHAEIKHRAGGHDLEMLRIAAAHVGAASAALRAREAPVDPAAAAGVFGHARSLHDAKLAFEHRLLEIRLNDARGNVAAAARALGMDRGQLSRLMRKHQLDRAAFRGPRVPPSPQKTA